MNSENKKEDQKRPEKKSLSSLDLNLLKEDDHLFDDHGNLIIGSREKKPTKKK